MLISGTKVSPMETEGAHPRITPFMHSHPAWCFKLTPAESSGTLFLMDAPAHNTSTRARFSHEGGE